MLNKKALSERDICTKYITPALVKAGWDTKNQMLEEEIVRVVDELMGYCEALEQHINTLHQCTQDLVAVGVRDVAGVDKIYKFGA